MKLNEILEKRDFSFKIIVVSNSAYMFKGKKKKIHKTYMTQYIKDIWFYFLECTQWMRTSTIYVICVVYYIESY